MLIIYNISNKYLIMNLLSIVVPCFNEEETVEIFLKEIQKVMGDSPFEIIFINDGSSDDTLRKIKNLVNTTSSVKYISFSRNFGKESAIYAGLKNATGDLICVMDADLQHPPSLQMFRATRTIRKRSLGLSRAESRPERTVRISVRTRFVRVLKLSPSFRGLRI